MSHRRSSLWRFVGCALAAVLALAAPGARAFKAYTGPEAEGDPAMFGAWTFVVQSLARSETAIGPVTKTIDVCLKLGAKPAELPLMAVPLQGRCVMRRLEMQPASISVLMLCEDFERRTTLSAHLQPGKDGHFAGSLSFAMTLEDSGEGSMQARAAITARRRGDC